jgi:hypothetical protein
MQMSSDKVDQIRRVVQNEIDIPGRSVPAGMLQPTGTYTFAELLASEQVAR